MLKITKEKVKFMNAETAVRNFLLGITKQSKAYFVGTTTKNPIEYKVGEQIVFKIRVELDGEPILVPYINYMTEGDDGVKVNDFLQPSDDGWFYIHTKLMREGFIHLVAKGCDDKKNIIEEIDAFEGGAGAGVEEIKCMTDIPDDYLNFWDSLRETAFSIPEKILFKEKVAVENGFEAYNVHYATPTGKFISAVYSYPTDAKDKSLKVMFINMGYGVGDCMPICRKGYLVVRCNTHDILNGQSQDYYDNIKLKGYGIDDREKNKRPETSFWYNLYFRDFQIVKYFKDHPLANGIDYEFEGSSQAAFQAVNLAAHTGIATNVRINVPWFCDIFAIQKANRIKIAWRPLEDDGLRYFDTAVGGNYLKCPIYIEAGLGDYLCPPSGQMALYNSISSPKKLRFIQNRTHPYMPPKVITNEISSGYNQEEFSFFQLYK